MRGPFFQSRRIGALFGPFVLALDSGFSGLVRRPVHLVKYLREFPNDPAVLTSIGQVLLGAGRAAEAAALFERMIRVEPGVASDYLHEGLAWKAAHQQQKAIEYLEKALERDPLLEQPYRELVQIYSETQNRTMLRLILDRYRRALPKSLEARAAPPASSAPRAIR